MRRGPTRRSPLSRARAISSAKPAEKCRVAAVEADRAGETVAVAAAAPVGEAAAAPVGVRAAAIGRGARAAGAVLRAVASESVVKSSLP